MNQSIMYFHESSPTLIYEACHPWQTELIRQVWAAAYAKGFADSDRGHGMLDDLIADQLETQVLITKETTRKNNLDNLEVPELAKVVQLYRPKYVAGKRALK